MATEAAIAKAFRNGVSLIADEAAIGALSAAIKRGDYAAAMAAIDIDDSAFDELRVLLVQTYAEGGVSEISGMPYAVKPRWNSASPRAEDYARNVIGQHITYISDDMRAAVTSAIRNGIADSLAFGRSVDRVALDIVGRKGTGGSRTGGIVGLNQQQEQWVTSMRRALSGDIAQSGKFWIGDDGKLKTSFSKMDRRFTSLIQSALLTGKPLTVAQIDRITSAYSDNLLRVRGLTIARTERGSAINAGRQEAWRQAADRAGLPYGAIWKEWRHSTRKMEPRITHILANKDRVQGLDTPFNIGGYFCLHPHDPTLPASEVVNCGCTVQYGINRRWRDG